MRPENLRSWPVTRRQFNRGLVASGVGALLLPGLLRGHAYGQAKPGGQLTVALYKDLRTLNPIMGIFGNEWRSTVNLYNNLTRLTASGGVEGDLAESYGAGQNSAVWTFVLRDGVRFHDGSLLSAADVVATIEKILDPKTAAPYKAELGPIAAVRAVDRRTVRIDLASPYADLPKALASSMARIVSERGVADFGKLDGTVYGTGPFTLREFVPNERVVMERNPRYFRAGRPFLDRLVLRVLPDTTSQIAALENREVDVIGEVESDAFKRVAGIKGVKAVQVTGGTFNNIVLYADRPPFDDPRVRKALRLAMDRPQMTDAITGGVGTPADDQPISPAYEYFDKAIHYFQLLEKNMTDDGCVPEMYLGNQTGHNTPLAWAQSFHIISGQILTNLMHAHPKEFKLPHEVRHGREPVGMLMTA